MARLARKQRSAQRKSQAYIESIHDKNSNVNVDQAQGERLPRKSTSVSLLSLSSLRDRYKRSSSERGGPDSPTSATAAGGDERYDVIRDANSHYNVNSRASSFQANPRRYASNHSTTIAEDHSTNYDMFQHEMAYEQQQQSKRSSVIETSTSQPFYNTMSSRRMSSPLFNSASLYPADTPTRATQSSTALPSYTTHRSVSGSSNSNSNSRRSHDRPVRPLSAAVGSDHDLNLYESTRPALRYSDAEFHYDSPSVPRRHGSAALDYEVDHPQRRQQQSSKSQSYLSRKLSILVGY